MSQEKQTLKLEPNITNKIKLNFDKPKTGSNDYGDWFLYGITHKGEEKNLFATKYLSDMLGKYGAGDVLKVTKGTNENKTVWSVIKVGEDNKAMSNGSMGEFKIDGRTRDIHKQVCLKLAVESLGVVKSDNDDSDYLKIVAYRMDKFLEVLEGKADSLVEKVKEEFAGEEIPF